MPRSLQLALLLLCAYSHAFAADNHSASTSTLNALTLKDALIQRLVSQTSELRPQGQNANRCVVVREPRDLSHPGWKKFATQATERIKKLSETHPADLKKLEEVANVLERYFPSYLPHLVGNVLDHDTLDYQYRLWVKFELYPTPANATAQEKLAIREKNRQLTFEVVQNTQKYYWMPLEEITSKFDAFYQTRSGKPLSEEFRARGITARSENYKKTLSTRPLLDRYRVPFELKQGMGISFDGELPPCIRETAHSWVTLGEKAELLFQLTKAGYGISETCQNGFCKTGIAGLVTKEQSEAEEAPKVSAPDKYVVDYLTRALQKTQQEARPLEEREQPAARWTEKGPLDIPSLDHLNTLNSKLLDATQFPAKLQLTPEEVTLSNYALEAARLEALKKAVGLNSSSQTNLTPEQNAVLQLENEILQKQDDLIKEKDGAFADESVFQKQLVEMMRAKSDLWKNKSLSPDFAKVDAVQQKIKNFLENKGPAPDKTDLETLTAFHAGLLAAQTGNTGIRPLAPHEHKRLNELHATIEQYQKSLAPFMQKRVQLGKLALESASSPAFDQRQRQDRDKQLHPHGNPQTKEMEAKYHLTQPLFIAPIEDTDPYFGKEVDFRETDLEHFKQYIGDKEAVAPSKLRSYEEHLKNQRASLNRELALNTEDAEAKNRNAIAYALKQLGDIPPSCNETQLTPTSSLAPLSDKKLLDLSYLVETGKLANPAIVKLVREEILCRLGDPSMKNLNGRICAGNQGYFFRFNSFDAQARQGEIPVVLTTGPERGKIQWNLILSEAGHAEPLIGSSPFERIYRNTVNTFAAQTSSFEDPESWWYAANQFGSSTWNLLKEEMGCAEFALIKNQLERMSAKISADAALLQKQQSKTAEDRQAEKKRIEEKLAALDKFSTPIAEEIKKRGTASGQLPSGRALAGASTEQLLDVLALKAHSPIEAENAARALMLPPHLWALRNLLTEIKEKEKDTLHKEGIAGGIDAQIEIIDKLTPEELTNEWLWYNTQIHSERAVHGHQQKKAYKPNWFASWIWDAEKFHASDVIQESSGSLEFMAAARLKEIEKLRENALRAEGQAVPQEEHQKQWLSKDGNSTVFFNYILDTAKAKPELFNQLITLTMDLKEINPTALGSARKSLIRTLKDKLGVPPEMLFENFDFKRAFQRIMDGNNVEEKQLLLATLHAIRSIDRALVTNSEIVEVKKSPLNPVPRRTPRNVGAADGGQAGANLATEKVEMKSAYSQEDIEKYFPSLSFHAGETPENSLIRYGSALVAELQLSEENADFLSGHSKEGNALRSDNGKDTKFGQFDRVFDAIANPNRIANIRANLKQTYLPETGVSGLQLIENRTGPLPTEARLKLYSMNPFVHEMLGTWIRPESYMTQHYVCAPAPAGKTSVRGQIIDLSSNRALRDEEKRPFMQHLFLDGSPSLIAEATIHNLYNLQHFLGQIENTPEMKELEKQGLDKKALFEILCADRASHPKALEMKRKLADLITAMGKGITVSKKGPNGEAYEEYDDSKPPYRTMQLASTLLGSLESFGTHQMSPDVRNFTQDEVRFSPEYARMILAEKQIAEQAQTKPELTARRDLVKEIESRLNSAGIALPAISRIALLTPQDQGGTTEGNLEGIVAAFNHLKETTAHPAEKAKSLRKVQELFVAPDPLAIASFLKDHQPGLLAHMRQLDSDTLLRKPLIDELIHTGTLSEESKKKLGTLAGAKYHEIYRDALTLMEGDQEAKEAHLAANLPAIALRVENEIKKEAAIIAFEDLLKKTAQKHGKSYPPKTIQEQASLTELAGKDASDTFYQQLTDLGKDHGLDTTKKADLKDAYFRLSHTSFLQRKVQEDLDSLVNGGAIPACLRENLVENALGSLSQGALSAIRDIANGRFRTIDGNSLQTLLWASKDLSSIDRGQTANSPYADRIVEGRMEDRINGRFNSLIRTQWLEKEISDLETRIEHTKNLLEQVKYSELPEEKKWNSGGNIHGAFSLVFGAMNVKDKQTAIAQYEADKKSWEEALRRRKADLEIAHKERESIDGLLNANANDRMLKENKDIESGRHSLDVQFYDLFTDTKFGPNIQNWARLYTKYCLSLNDWEDRYTFSRDFSNESELGDGTALGYERGQELVAYEALTKRQSLLARGRNLGRDLASAEKSLIEKEEPGAYVRTYLEKHPNKHLLETWIADARELGMSEATAKQMLDRWLKEGEVLAHHRQTQETKLIAEINTFRFQEPIVTREVRASRTGAIIRIPGPQKPAEPILAWNGLAWEINNPTALQNLSAEEKSRLSSLFTEFQAFHSGANHPLKELKQVLIGGHAENQFSPYFPFQLNDNKTYIARAISSPEDKQHGGVGFRYEILDSDKVQEEIGGVLKRIYVLLRDVNEQQITIDHCMGAVIDKLKCAAMTAYKNPIKQAMIRRDEILTRELPGLINLLKDYGNIIITKDPERQYSQMPAMAAAADLMLKNLKMGEESIVQLQKAVKDVDGVVGGAAAEYLAFKLPALVGRFTGVVSESSPWLSRAAMEYAGGARGALGIHFAGEGFSWVTQNGLGAAAQAYYASYGQKHWDDLIKNGGGNTPLKMAGIIDLDGNNIPDFAETGNWRWAPGADPKQDALGFLKSAFTVFGPAHVLNTTQWSRAILSPAWQHPINFGIAEFGSTFLTAPIMTPNQTWGEITKEAVTSFARGTAFGVPYWKLAAGSKTLNGWMANSPKIGNLLGKVGITPDRMKSLENSFLTRKIGKWGQGVLETNGSTGALMAQFAGLEGIDVAMYTLDRAQHPELHEQNPGIAGYWLGLGSHLGQGMAMNLYFLGGVGKQYKDHQNQQRYLRTIGKIKSKEYRDIDTMVRASAKDPAFKGENPDHVKIATLQALMTLPVGEFYEVTRALKEMAVEDGRKLDDIKYLARNLSIPGDRLLPALETVANSKIPGGIRFPALEATIGRAIPFANKAPLMEQHTRAQLSELVTRAIKADYDKGMTSTNPKETLAAKKRLAQDISEMGPVAVSKFDPLALAATLNFNPKKSTEMAYEKQIAEAIGKNLMAEGWERVDVAEKVRLHEADQFSRFASDVKEGQKDIRLTYLLFRNVQQSRDALKDLLLDGRFKSGPQKAVELFGKKAVTEAIDRAERQARMQPVGPKREETLAKLQPLLKVRDGIEDALNFSQLRITNPESASMDPNNRTISVEEEDLIKKIITQRPESMDQLGIRFFRLNKTADVELLKAYAARKHISYESLTAAIQRHFTKAVDGVNSLEDLVRYEKSARRLPSTRTNS